MCSRKLRWVLTELFTVLRFILPAAKGSPLGDALKTVSSVFITILICASCGPGLEEGRKTTAVVDGGLRYDAEMVADAQQDGAYQGDLGEDAAWQLPDPKGPPVQLSAGGWFTCALHRPSGSVRCWGKNDEGQLGQANSEPIGDDEVPSHVDTITIAPGERIVQIASGKAHSCALLSRGAVRCWGSNKRGQLGYGHTMTIGDDETPEVSGDVLLGGRARFVAAGVEHTCVLLDQGGVQCWGNGMQGRLGYGNQRTLGDDELPSGQHVSLGGRAISLCTGEAHSCALLDDHRVRCWGYNYRGQLGYALGEDQLEPIGDDELPSSIASPIRLGGPVVDISCGDMHSCAVLASGGVRCWGEYFSGKLGYAGKQSIGDDEAPGDMGTLPLKGLVRRVSAGGSHSCALLRGLDVQCWGMAQHGALGIVVEEIFVGAGERALETVGKTELGGSVAQIVTGSAHSCALLVDGRIRCWGSNGSGQLGYPGVDRVGRDNTPQQFGLDVDVFP